MCFRKDLKRRLHLTEASAGMATSSASLDELVLVPKNYLQEKLHEIKELEGEDEVCASVLGGDEVGCELRDGGDDEVDSKVEDHGDTRNVR